MEVQAFVSKAPVVHLCDVLLERLEDYVNASHDIKAFADEIRTLQKFLDLIDRVFKAKSPRMAFEEQHFTSVEILMNRCQETLRELAESFAVSEPEDRQNRREKYLQETLLMVQTPQIMALRTRISFYIKSLQMSLQTVKL